jgi:hypothetical protein
MTDSDTIQWHNHFEQRLEDRGRLEDERWEAQRRAQILRDDQLKVQAEEYARRLDLLNGETEKIAKIHAEKLDHQLYRSEHKEVVVKVEILIAQNIALTEKVAELKGTISTLDSSLTWFRRSVFYISLTILASGLIYGLLHVAKA